MRFELPFGRIGVAAGLLLVHVLVLFGLFTIARRPALPPAPVSVVSFISTTSKEKPWQPQMVEATTADVSLPIPAAPAIETAVPVGTAPEVIAVPAEAAEPQTPAVVGPANQPPRVESVVYIREPAIRYPLQSRRSREQGVVLFQVLVDERGIPAKIEVERSSGFVRLDEAGREALLQARFRPYTENGVARSAIVLVPLRFNLKRR